MHKFTIVAVMVFALSALSPWASTAQASAFEDVVTQVLTQSSQTSHLAEVQQLAAYIQETDKQTLLSQLSQAVMQQYMPNAGAVSGLDATMAQTALNGRVNEFLYQYQDELAAIDAFLDGRDADLFALVGSYGQALAGDLEAK